MAEHVNRKGPPPLPQRSPPAVTPAQPAAPPPRPVPHKGNSPVWVIPAAAAGLIVLVILAALLISSLARPSIRAGSSQHSAIPRGSSNDAGRIAAMIEKYARREGDAYREEHTTVQRDRLLAEAAQQLEADIRTLGIVELRGKVQDISNIQTEVPTIGKPHPRDTWRIAMSAPSELESVISQRSASWTCSVLIQAPGSRLQSIKKGDTMTLKARAGYFGERPGSDLQEEICGVIQILRVPPEQRGPGPVPPSWVLKQLRHVGILAFFRDGAVCTVGSQEWRVASD